MLRRIRREDGTATLEFGLLLPILLILGALTFPLLKAGYEYISINRAVSHAIRYASRADENARYAPDGITLTRRPSSSEVEAFVLDAVGPDLSDDVTSVTVTPEPFNALPGERIVINATYQVSFGALDNIANAVHGAFFGGGAYLPEASEVTVSARGREE